ncbi:metallophosphoesterase [Enterovirga aerilata]|uniref:Metallophosphoesterase n=1 Tax=Enterovirga aerilata TaxID=2730920 RepID=A0A849I960_9HYPH|nr:metallophosphoesterase [Enterovirga sp. DB1703]NNM73851.1 metallophosphoesterase [Enterovirga sp. DB1703]
MRTALRLAMAPRPVVAEPRPDMRLWVMSDLAGEPEFQIPDPLPDFDAILVAGDVRRGLDASLTWLAKTFDHVRRGRPLVLVPGDAELAGDTPLREAIAGGRKRARDLGIALLCDDLVRLSGRDGRGVHVIGACLWTDWALGYPCTASQARAYARNAWPGERQILLGRGRPLAPHDVSGLHARSRAFIEDCLASIVVQAGGHGASPRTLVPGVRRGDRAVVVTHFAPSVSSLPPDIAARTWEPWRAAFLASNLEAVMTRWGAPALWLHGHVPRPVAYRLGDTRVVANPRGRAEHNRSFDPALVLEV